MNYKLNTERILFTQLGDEGVLYDIQSNEYVTLNETFFKILQGVEQGKSPSEMVTLLCEEYDINPTECTIEVEAAIQQLAEKGFLNGYT